MPWVLSGGGDLHSSTALEHHRCPLSHTHLGHKGLRCLKGNLYCFLLSVCDGSVYHLPSPAMILAGRAYYDGVAKIGEIATGSPVSTELGELTIRHLYT